MTSNIYRYVLWLWPTRDVRPHVFKNYITYDPALRIAKSKDKEDEGAYIEDLYSNKIIYENRTCEAIRRHYGVEALPISQ